MRVPEKQLTDHARVWIFGAKRPFSAAEREVLEREMESFTSEWKSKGNDVISTSMILEDRFLLVAVDENIVASGCGIDKLTRKVRDLDRQLSLGLMDSSLVHLRGESAIESLSRQDFRQRAERGQAGADTTVFDLTTEQLGEVRNGRWQRPAGESWHAAAFQLMKPVRR